MQTEVREVLALRKVHSVVIERLEFDFRLDLAFHSCL